MLNLLLVLFLNLFEFIFHFRLLSDQPKIVIIVEIYFIHDILAINEPSRGYQLADWRIQQVKRQLIDPLGVNELVLQLDLSVKLLIQILDLLSFSIQLLGDGDDVRGDADVIDLHINLFLL